jgi:quercetin dioxygenase-like cupin family protein
VFEEYLLSNTIAPSPTVKFAVMESVYKQQAEKDKTYFPLLNEHTEKAEIRSWLENNAVPGPDTAFDNLFFLPLPSTPFVTNIMVWAKEGHEKEMHTEYKEYLYLIKGSCTMYYENNAKSYSEGDIITIPTHVDHYAVVTSDFPMIAIVQRQACA